jgi:flavorubredoxin
MKAAILYWSKTGNTEKVAGVIREVLEEAGSEILYKRTEDADDVDFFDYDIVFLGFPSYQWAPPRPVEEFLAGKFSTYRNQGKVKVGAPKVPGRSAVIFCTYSGPHTGLNEAIPATKRAGQFFEHLGFAVLDEWHVVGEFHGSEEMSTKGRLGDIRGRPNEDDLKKVRQEVVQLLSRI